MARDLGSRDGGAKAAIQRTFAELIEPSGNYGTPAALLLLCGGFYAIRSELQRRLRLPQSMDEATLGRVFWCFRVTMFLLLLGHGWLNMIGKPGLISQYRSLGLEQPMQIAHYVGSFELLSAFAILLFPNRPFLLVILAWKMASELLYPKYELFEWIERRELHRDSCSQLLHYIKTHPAEAGRGR